MSGECTNGVAFQNAVNALVAGAQAASIPVTARDTDLFVPAANLAALQSYLASNGFTNPAYAFADEHGSCLRYDRYDVAALAALGDGGTPGTVTVHVGTDNGR